MFEKKSDKNNSSCEDCMHYIICGHKDHMKKVSEQIDGLKIEKGEFIEITARCTEFRATVPMPRGGSSIHKN